jgi:small subunit ribosomal protein S17
MSKVSGKVVSIIDWKTVKVCVSYAFPHEKYKKIVKTSKNVMCHDENGTVTHIGQQVLIIPGRPMSKLKTWHIVDNEK